MALSLPVVASTADGTVEIIEHEAQGLLGPPGDAQALRAALERLLSEPVLRQQLADAGHRRVVEEFTFQKTMQQTEALYYDYLRRKAPGRLSRPSIGTLATGERL
jgi:glycosyltransferase involved in cell wall biosynthesis